MNTTNCFNSDSPAAFGAFQDSAVGSYAASPTKALAKGVLRQAAKDLRLFHGAEDSVGRAVYMDAYTWLLSNNISWPYSFINVCELLGLPIETTRSETLIDAQSRWDSRFVRTVKRMSGSFRDAVATAFGSRAASQRSARAIPLSAATAAL